jgi:uncharacterized protein (AIM24 family)
MQYKIHGENVKTVDILMNQGEALFADAGNLAWMRGEVRVEIPQKSGVKGRKSAESSNALCVCYSNKCLVVMTPEVPGQIIDIPLAEGDSLICQKGTLLCAEGSVGVTQFYQQKMPGYGSEGYILQQLTAPGTVFTFAAGEARQYELKQGEIIKVDPAHIVCFDPTMTFDFSGEMAVVSGPGKIWFQTMAMPYLSSLIGQYKSGR